MGAGAGAEAGLEVCFMNLVGHTHTHRSFSEPNLSVLGSTILSQ